MDEKKNHDECEYATNNATQIQTKKSKKPREDKIRWRDITHGK